jgi:hypothetical protein
MGIRVRVRQLSLLGHLRHMQPSDFTYALSPTPINNPHRFGSGFFGIGPSGVRRIGHPIVIRRC